jgi:hypothetical protein
MPELKTEVLHLLDQELNDPFAFLARRGVADELLEVLPADEHAS